MKKALNYDEVRDFDANGFACVRKKGEWKWGLINTKGEEVLKPKYKGLDSISGTKLYRYAYKNYGIMDTNFTEIIPPEYELISKVSNNNIIIIEKDEKFGFISNKGKMLVKPKYDRLENNYWGNLIETLLNNKYGLINNKGKVIVDTIYDYTRHFNSKIAKVKIDKKIGIIDKKGNLRLPIKYDEISLWDLKNEIIVRIKNKCGVFNLNFKQVIPLKYKNITDYDGVGVLKVTNFKDKQGLLDIKGNIIVKCNYDEIGKVQSNGMRIVRLKGNTYLMDKEFKLV